MNSESYQPTNALRVSELSWRATSVEPRDPHRPAPRPAVQNKNGATNSGVASVEISKNQLLELLNPEVRSTFLMAWPAHRETVLLECYLVSNVTGGGSHNMTSPVDVPHCSRCRANLSIKDPDMTGKTVDHVLANSQ